MYKTIILPVFYMGMKFVCYYIREEHRLKVFENKVMKIFGPKGKKVTGG
jgi:hypothetical protein